MVDFLDRLKNKKIGALGRTWHRSINQGEPGALDMGVKGVFRGIPLRTGGSFYGFYLVNFTLIRGAGGPRDRVLLAARVFYVHL